MRVTYHIKLTDLSEWPKDPSFYERLTQYIHQEPKEIG